MSSFSIYRDEESRLADIDEDAEKQTLVRQPILQSPGSFHRRRFVRLAVAVSIVIGSCLFGIKQHNKEVDIPPASRNYIQEHEQTRPLLFNLPYFMNSSIKCDIPIAITDDEYAADVWIGDAYAEDRGDYNHSNRASHWQTFALFTIEENPIPAFMETKMNRSLGLPSYYDLLISYELDSDLPITYRQISKFKDLRAAPVPFQDKLQNSIAAAFMSNCAAPHNNRTAITRELIELLPGQINSYGHCNKNKELSEDFPHLDVKEMGWEEVKQAVIGRHKFVLAFENANTVDYVTEKYWDALAAGSVPVYLGAPNLRTHFLPHPKAAVIASDFDTVADLAAHLVQLANNETAYNEYLEWKNLPFDPNFQRIVQYSDDVAPLCRLAHLAKGDWSNPLKDLNSGATFAFADKNKPRIGSS